jgi:hypothetical protein
MTKLYMTETEIKEQQATLAQSNDLYYALCSLAQNHKLAPEAQAILMQSGDKYVLYSLAKNPNLTPEHQTTLAQISNADLLQCLAFNPNLTAEAQVILANNIIGMRGVHNMPFMTKLDDRHKTE